MAIEDGIEVRAVRGHRRGSAWHPVTHGVHRVTVASDDDREWIDELAGWQLLMTSTGCFTGLTALRLRGVELPPLPATSPVFIALDKNDPRPMRTGVVTSRHKVPVPHDLVHGLRVATAGESVVASARWLGLLDTVCVIDACLQAHIATYDELLTLSRTRRPGARALRTALELVDGRAESVPESMLRLLHVSCEIAVEPQWPIKGGPEVGTLHADIWLVGTIDLHEYDGDEHEKAPRRVKDARRLRRIDRAGLVRRGYTMGDLLHRPVTILADADRAVGRTHDPSRIRLWHDWLRDSLWTSAGSAAFLRRLPRATPRRRTA